MKRNNKKGFTLAELLIVVAIIAVLVAVAIPVFTTQLDKAKIATEQANARSVYAEQVAAYLDASGAYTPVARTIDGVTYTPSISGNTWTITLTNKKSTGGASSYTFGIGS